MSLELTILIIILISVIFTKLARRLHLSDVIGLIFVGIFLSIPFIREFIIGGHEEFIASLANIGLYTLMFLAGFEFSWNMLLKEEKSTVVVTLFTIITSLFFGTTVFYLLGFSFSTALVMGICFGITAEATKARVLIQLNKLKSKVGTLMMSTGIINDVVGILLFSGVLYFFANSFSFGEVEILIGMLVSLFAGMLVHIKYDRLSQSVQMVEKFLLNAVVPFFFVNMGILFSSGIEHVSIIILLITIITASAGQIVGVFLTKSVTKLRAKQLYLLGWGMNSKGAVELAIAYIALNAGLLTKSLYSSIVIMVIITTFLFQIIIFKTVKKNPGIMD